MTTKEFLRKNNLEMDDLSYIEDLVTMGKSFEKIAALMDLDAEELRAYWEGQ